MTAKKSVPANISREVQVGKVLAMCAQQILQGNDPLLHVHQEFLPKRELSQLTGHPPLYFDRHVKSGDLRSKLEITDGMRVRRLINVADVRALLDRRSAK